MILDSKPWTLGSLFEGKYFRIPRYQRPYSWERPHLEEFWQDAVQSRSEEDYFIGSIVASKPRREHVYAVVDGQQRLTTATILLCVIRDAFQDEGHSDLADGIHTLVERRNIRNRQQYVLTTESSYPFLQENIQKRGKPELADSIGPEEEALKMAYDFFVGKVNAIVQSVKSDSSLGAEAQSIEVARKLEAARDQVLMLQVIFVELENEDDAYLVFETLNTRGKDLRVSDLVKNLVLRMKRPTNVGVDVGKEKWDRILETLEESEAGIRVDAFLHHSWISRYDFVAQKALFKAVKTSVKQPQVDGFLDSLIADSCLYRVIFEPDFRNKKWLQQESDIRRALRAINLFGVRLSLPLVLALMRDWEAGAVKLQVVRETLAAIEAFHFLSNAIGQQRVTGGLTMMFASLAHQLHTSPPNKKASICSTARRKLRERVPDKETFLIAFRKIIYTKSQTKQKSLVKYVLERIADYRNWTINAAELSVEHFASQSTRDLPDTVTGQIGNLLLVPPKLNNERLRNRSFAEKKKALDDAQFPLSPSMAAADSWGENEIESHTDELARLAYTKIWRI